MDTIYGGYGDDEIYSEVKNPTTSSHGQALFGGAGNDSLYGSLGNESFVGDEGNDFIDPWYGRDTVGAGDGSDQIQIRGLVTVNGGNDSDRFDIYADALGRITDGHGAADVVALSYLTVGQIYLARSGNDLWLGSESQIDAGISSGTLSGGAVVKYFYSTADSVEYVADSSGAAYLL